MKKFAYLLALLVMTACGSESPIIPEIDHANEFIVQDNAKDPVQHARYMIFKEFGIPVYFNDTLAVRVKGTDYDGTQRKRYETIDLNWTFSGYDQGVKYSYVYLKHPEEQMKALAFVRKFLSASPKPLRPFSIMVADTLTKTSKNKVERPIYHVGFRTLVFAQIKDINSEDSLNIHINNVVKNMIADRVEANKVVCARFANVSSEKGWYSSSWADLGNCPTILKWSKKSWTFSPNVLFNEPPYTPYESKDLVTLLLEKDVEDAEEAEQIRQEYINEMGRYGFICGWKYTGVNTPNDDKEDRAYFLQAIIYLGEQGFIARYGNSKLVMEKYKILANFITKELGYDLNYDGRLQNSDNMDSEPME